ncbi:Rieske 2Fe-2S domain-containing protein [Maribacter sp. TH_r10]|uniref:QcrA and Rieske domain-containing protein n=1 Tax=Maribacter sp. TH_r10 TaxID=3082086 RepID=UPI002954105A|nr:Rieske 2Fe-2S domain-containing protein [Maribacter sp. TH_r10]MDV7139725.1 Rieske 2Fe-2S domain-containing protein [Maribacter sp. TH_r10]
MERKEFLRTLGAGAAFALTFPCLQGCSKDDENGDKVETPTGIDFTIDLNSTEGQALAENGSFILKELVVVVKNLEGNFIAASQVCSHQQTEEVRFIDSEGGIFACSEHGARFDQSGLPLNSVTGNSLKIYNTELNGDILRVYE